MANYSSLLAAVNAAITANGTGAITGPVLNTVLQQMIVSLGQGGYIFKGRAIPTTDPGSPDQNVFYIATTPGTYTNFSSIVVAAGECAILKGSGTSWSKEATGIDLVSVSQNSQTGHVDINIGSDAYPVASVQEILGNTIDSENDLSLSDGLYDIVQFSGGHIKTKNFDSRESDNILNEQSNGTDFSIADKDGYEIVQFKSGDIITKNFDSSDIKNKPLDGMDFSISDSNGYDLAQFKDGHIKTKNFDSRDAVEKVAPYLMHIIMLGQSLSVGYIASPILNKVNSKRAYMFKHIRTFDLGYIFGITHATYNADQATYDASLYELNALQEGQGYGTSGTSWTDGLAPGEYETPCSGIIEGILKGFQEMGYTDIPFFTLCSASGIGGSGIDDELKGTEIFERTKRDISAGFSSAMKLGVGYMPVLVWMQGEHDSRSMEIATYKQKLISIYEDYLEYVNTLGVGTLKMFSYQTAVKRDANYPNDGGNSGLAQMELNNEKDWFKIAAPSYNFQHAIDYVHLTGYSSRQIGNAIGNAIFKDIKGYFEALKIAHVDIDSSNNLLVYLNKEFDFDSTHLLNWGGYDVSDETQTLQNMGFWPYDANGNYVFSSITKISNTCIKIACSDTPTVLGYGLRPPHGYIMGGCVREKSVVNGYNDDPVYRYMPAQIIDEFSEQFDFINNYS